MSPPRRLPIGLALAMLSTLFVFACSDGITNPPTREIVSITLSSPVDVARSLGQRFTIGATMLDASGESILKPLVWSSSDDGVITVTTGGSATTVGNGMATITASGDGVHASLDITVRQHPAELLVTAPDTVFSTGVRTRLSVVATDSAGSAYVRTPLEWSSSAPLVVAVEPGMALPRSEGTATITIRADSVERTHSITVIDAIGLEVPSALAESLQWAVEDTAIANGVIGTVATVFVPGLGTWTGVYGRSNPTEVLRQDMLFYPGSMAKSILAALLLSLADEGVLSLDDRVGDWLAPFDHGHISADVTLRQLILGTSGIAEFQTHPAVGDSLGADLDRVWTMREVLEKFMPPPLFEPGTSWLASSSGFVLAALVSEAATSQTIVELLRERVFDRMGLREASVQYYEQPPTTVADTWRGPTGGPLVSSADLQTTTIHTFLTPQPVVGAEALAIFTRELFGSYLTPSMRSEMMDWIPVTAPAWSHQVGAGLGIRRYDFLGRVQWGHSGSQGTGSGFFLWDEGSGIVVTVLHNQSAASHNSSHFGLVPALLGLALQAIAP